MKNFTPRNNLQNYYVGRFLPKFLTKKISNEQFHLCDVDFTLKPYNHFFKWLYPTFLGVFHSWNWLDTMGISSRIWAISVIHKYLKRVIKDTANYRSILLLNLDYKMYTLILENCMQRWKKVKKQQLYDSLLRMRFSCLKLQGDCQKTVYF